MSSLRMTIGEIDGIISLGFKKMVHWTSLLLVQRSCVSLEVGHGSSSDYDDIVVPFDPGASERKR